jgi:HD-like signal output (HDOD) protein
MTGGTEISARAIDLVEEMMDHGHLPALSTNANEICAIAGHSNTCVADLAAIIMRDCGMTANILTTTNSALYSPRVPIKTISAAVSFLGFHRVRTLVLGLELFREGAANARSQNLVRLYANSYFAGSFAQSLARDIGYSDPEEIFVAGLLCQLPSMALANSFPEKFREMENLIRESAVDQNQACVVVFGCGFDDICRALAQIYHIPGKVHEILAGEKQEDDKMLTLVVNAVKVSRLLFSDQPNGLDAVHDAEAILRKITGKDDFEVGDFIRKACDEDPNIGRYFNLAAEDIDIMVRILEWGKASPSRVMTGLSFQDGQLNSKDRDPEALIGHFLTELLIAQKKGKDINHMLMLAQEAIYRCVSDVHVILAFLDFKTHVLQGRFYAGSNSVIKASDFRINDTAIKSPLIKALSSPEITEWQAGKDHPLGLPAFITRKLKLRRAAIAPIMVNGRGIGIHFIGRAREEEFTDQELVWVEQIAERVADAFLLHAQQAKSFTSKTL